MYDVSRQTVECFSYAQTIILLFLIRKFGNSAFNTNHEDGVNILIEVVDIFNIIRLPWIISMLITGEGAHFCAALDGHMHLLYLY